LNAHGNEILTPNEKTSENETKSSILNKNTCIS